jgi:DNA polymerase-3 subunit epsilon
MSFFLRLKKKFLLHKYGGDPNFKRFFADIDLSRPIEETTFTVFDTETTGLDPKSAELVSVGALRVRKMTLDLSEAFHSFTKPQELTKSSVEIHGITRSELEKRAQPIERVIESFLLYTKGTVLVGFNVEFDRRMVEKYTLKFFGLPLLNYRLDVFHLWKKRGGEGKSLKEIGEELNLPVAGTHSALDDAYITALIFLKLVYRMKGEPIGSLPLML